MNDNSTDWAGLFAQHLKSRCKALADDLSATGFDGLVLTSGRPFRYFADDQDAPFHTSGHFKHWCPIDGPHHALVLEADKRPKLIRFAPEDYWYEQLPLGEPFWLSGFELEEAGTEEAVWDAIRGGVGSRSGQRFAYVGDAPELAKAAGLTLEVESLEHRLDWFRGYKTDYELACLSEASRLGALGHQAALSTFRDGGSELDIHHAFVRSVGTIDRELPYPTIIAFDEKAAILHYEGKRTVKEASVLLIDAGAQHGGYASDITRTHVKPDCDPRFQAILGGMNLLQQRLCSFVKPGMPNGELHHRAHLEIASLLKTVGILKADPDEAVAEGWSRPFFPHGLGHHLGIYVHDVGGHLADPSGKPASPPKEHPFLRNTRALEPRHVFTVEPGVYFIPMLLREFREGPAKDHFDWSLIDALTPLGGIRVEDNIVVTEDGHRNLTREYLRN